MTDMDTSGLVASIREHEKTDNPDWFHYYTKMGKRRCFRIHEVTCLEETDNGCYITLYGGKLLLTDLDYDEVLEAVVNCSRHLDDARF